MTPRAAASEKGQMHMVWDVAVTLRSECGVALQPATLLPAADVPVDKRCRKWGCAGRWPQP